MPVLRRLVATVLVALAAFQVAPARAQDKPVVVFAAMSTKTALDEIRTVWQARTGKVLTVSYGSSAALARQIEQGAPANVFISADLDWLHYLSARKLTVPGSERPLLGNGRLALCDPSVPIGKYANAALEALGAWRPVQSKLALAADAVLVARGEAPLGIVYATDVAADPRLKIVGVFPADTHPPIVYPIALLAGTTNPDAGDFVKFLGSIDARPFFERQGFTLPGAAHLPQ